MIDRPFLPQTQVPQEPDEPSVLARAWRRSLNDKWPEGFNGSGTPQDWEKYAKFKAGKGEAPALTTEEGVEFLANQTELAVDLRKRQTSETRTEYFDYLKESQPPKVAAYTQLAIRQAEGEELNANGMKSIWGDMGEGEREAHKGLMANYQYLRNHPMASVEGMRSEGYGEMLKAAYAEGGGDRLRSAATLLESINPKLANDLLGITEQIEGMRAASEVLGVGITGGGEGANLYAIHLGLGDGFEKGDYRSSRQKQKTAKGFAGHMLRAMDESGLTPGWLDSSSGMTMPSDRAANISWREALEHPQENIQVKALERFFQDNESRELLRRIVGESRAEAALSLNLEVGGRLGHHLLQFGKGLTRVLEKTEDGRLLTAENPQDIIAQAMNIEKKDPNQILGFLVDVAGSGSRIASSLSHGMSARYGVRGFMFQDGSIVTDEMEAALKYAGLVGAGALPGMHPKLDEALRERHGQLGIGDGKYYGPFDFLNKKTEALLAREGGVQLGGRMYAAPIPILDRTDDASWSEAWDGIKMTFSGEGEFVMDLLGGRYNLGRVGDGDGSVDSFVADLIIDPLNVIGFGGSTTMRGTVKAQKKIGEAALDMLPNLDDAVRAGFELTDPSLAKGYDVAKFADGKRMSPQASAAAKLISARMGGGPSGDLFAQAIMTEIKNDPSIVMRGVKRTLFESHEHFSSLLSLAGDGRIMQAKSGAARQALAQGANAAEAGKMANEAGMLSFRRMMDAAIPDVEAVLKGLKQTTRKPNASWSGQVRRGLLEGNAGVRAGAGNLQFTFSASPAMRAAERAYGALKQGEKMGAALSTVEKALKTVSIPVTGPMRMAAAIFSPTHWRTQVNGKVVRIPLYTRRLYRQLWGQVHARVTEMAPITTIQVVRRALGDEAGAKWITGHAASDRRKLTHVIGFGGTGRSSTEIAESIAEWNSRFGKKGIPEFQGMKPAEIQKEVERLKPIADGISEEFRRMMDIEVPMGLQRELVEDGYIPIVVRSSQTADTVIPTEAVAKAGNPMKPRGGGEHLGSSQQLRRMFESPADAIRLGADVETDALALLTHRIGEHHLAVNSSKLIEAISTQVGVPLIQGHRAALEVMATGPDAQWAKIGQTAETWNDRSRYAGLESSYQEASNVARGSRGKFRRLKSNLGLGTAAMSDPRAVLGRLNSERTLRSLASKRDKFWDSVIPDPQLREQVRTAAKEVLDSLDKGRRWKREAALLGLRVDTKGRELFEILEDVQSQLGVARNAKLSDPARRKLLRQTTETITEYRAMRLEEAAKLRKARSRRNTVLRKEEQIVNRSAGVNDAGTLAAEKSVNKQVVHAVRSLRSKQRELDRIVASLRALHAKKKTAHVRRSLEYRADELLKEIDSLQSFADEAVRSTKTQTDWRKAADKVRGSSEKEFERLKEASEARRELNEDIARIENGISSWDEAIGDMSTYARELNQEVKAIEGAGKKAKGQAERKAASLTKKSEAVDKAKDILSRRVADAIHNQKASGKYASQVLSSPAMRQVAVGVSDYARKAAASEGAVRSIVGSMARVTGLDAFDRREAIRRMKAGRKTLPDMTKDLSAHLPEAEARAYQQVQDVLTDAGLVGDRLGAVLWDLFGVTRVQHLKLNDALGLIAPGGAVASLERIIGDPVRALSGSGALQTPKTAESLLKGLGFKKRQGESVLDMMRRGEDYFDELEDAAALGDAAANAKLGKMSEHKRQQLKRALVDFDKFQLGRPLDAGEGAELVRSGAAKQDGWVKAMTGKTPFARQMEDLMVPLDMALVMRTMLGEKISREGVAEMISIGTGFKALSGFTRMWKSVVTDGAFGPAFAMRQKLDAVMGQIHISLFDTFSPTFRKELGDLINGRIDGFQTASGWVSRAEFMEQLARLQTSIGGRFDLNSLRGTVAKKQTHTDRMISKSIQEFELSVRGTGEALPKGHALKVRAKAHALPAVLGTLGGVAGLAFAGPAWALALGASSYTGAYVGKSLRSKGAASAGGRSEPTLREYLLPLHGSGAEVNENYMRALTLLYNRKRGLSNLDSTEKTLLQTRDYSNYKSEERSFIAHIPILFYNFIKQNTLAQISRIADRPAGLAFQLKLLEFFDTELPEEMRPDWMPQMNSFIRRGKAWYLPTEITQPFEMAAALGNMDEAVGMLNPVIREAWEGGLFKSEELPAAMARELHKKYGDRDMTGVRIWADDQGRPHAEIGAVGSIFLLATGMETIVRNAGRMNEAVLEDEWTQVALQFFVGIKAYDLKAPLEQKLAPGGRMDEALQKLSELSDNLVTRENGRSLDFAFTAMEGMDQMEWMILNEIVRVQNGEYGKAAVQRLVDFIDTVKGEAKKSKEAAPTK